MAKHLKNTASKKPKKKVVPRKTFLDMLAPGVIKFNPDTYIRDNMYCCVWALKEYPASTEEQAILRHLGEKSGVNIRIYTRIVDAMEENRIIQNATNKNKLNRANTNDTKQMITAEGNLQDVFEMVNSMRKKREPLIHCAVFIELSAPTMPELERLQSEVVSELLRSKLNVDRLRLRQQRGYLSACPQGYNAFGSQFERVLPASSVANFYIRNCLKRVRKKESAMVLASQNLDDFDQPNVREMTKPLFSIPPHQFLFNAGSIDKRSYMDMLQLEESEYDLIRYPQRGVCLYKCGNERYLLEVHAPPYKEVLFGSAGGR